MILAFGELLWDILEGKKQLGGAVANCAYRLSELGDEVVLVSRVGTDQLGDHALEILHDKGLSTEAIQRDAKFPTGTVDITLSSSGDATYHINPEVAYDRIELTKELSEWAQNATAIIFGTLIQRSEKSRDTLQAVLAQAPNALKVVDINLRKDCYTPESLRSSLENSDVLKLNKDEIAVVAPLMDLRSPSLDEFCATTIDKFGLSTVVVTLGADGLFALDANEGCVRLPGFSIKIADTVGAGDNFTAGFIHRRLAGGDLRESCQFANALGSLAATKTGGMPTITPIEIESRLSA